MDMRRRKLLWWSAIVIVGDVLGLGSGGGAFFRPARWLRRARLPDGRFPNVVLTTHEGRAIGSMMT